MGRWFNRFMMAAVCSFGVASAANATDWSEQDQLDGQCVAYYAAELGSSKSESPDPGVMALIGYFVGKIEGRNPGFDLVALLTPEFINNAEKSWAEISTRCGAEGEKFGESLTAAGQALASRDDT